MIEAIALTKKYGPFEALSNLSFSLNEGEVVGLLGPNGAGKTTTMRILTGYMPPTSGIVKISGFDLLESPQEAKKNLGYLPETPPLYPDLTVEEMLVFAAGLRNGSASPKSQTEKVEKALLRTGTQDVRKRLIGNLSKGYRQRVGIAQALIHEPTFLILDEPTSGLDPKQIIEIRDLIHALKEEKNDQKGVSILLSSHILQEIGMVCDRVLIMNKGQLVANGTISELTAHLHKKRYVVTLAETASKEDLKRVPGVEMVEDYSSGLEEVFLEKTGGAQ